MKPVNKVLFCSGKSYLSIAILTITLVGIISTSIVTDSAAHYNNSQASSTSIVDVSFIGAYHAYEEYTVSSSAFDLSLPTSHVFFSHTINIGGCILSTNDSLTSVPEGVNTTSLMIITINFSQFHETPFNETIDNPTSLSNTSGVYLIPQLINMYNLTLHENFSLYFATGNLTTQSLHNLTLIDEFTVKNKIWFMQLFGLHEYYQYQGISGVMLMDSQYYKRTFETEEGTPKLTITSSIALNFIFEKKGLLEKTPSTVARILSTTIHEIEDSSTTLGYYFYHYRSSFLDAINEISYTFTIFQVFIILGSFPIFLFAWWVNKTFLNTSLNSQSTTLRVLLCKGVSKSDIRKKLLWKSVIIGMVSWIVAVLLSQVLSWGLQSYLFEYAGSIVFSIHKLLNVNTLIILPLGIGISFLSTLSALNTILEKEKDSIVPESDLEESRFLRRHSTKRALIFLVLSLLPLILLILPIFGIEIPQEEYFPSLLISMVSVLAIVAPFFFVIAIIDLVSLNAQKLKWRQKRTAKSRKEMKNYSRVLVFKRIVLNVKKHAQFLFMITISLTIIAQSLTYNSIMELNHDQTDLIQNGNGFRLDFQISNESYTYFNPIAQDVRENTEINSLVQNDIAMYIAKETPLSSYSLTLINSSEWKAIIDIPRNWISLPSKQVYGELSTNGSILVSETFLEQEDYQIGDSFTFIYETIDGQPKQKELTIVGSFSRFPLLTSTLTDSPACTNIIADLSFFSDVELTDIYWVFYPVEKEYVKYDLYNQIRTQISASDTNNSIGILTEVGDILAVEPDIPYSKFLQVEGIGLGVIILIGLIILVNRQFHSSSGAGYQFRMKGMSKRTIRRFYLTEFIVILMFSFLIFIPSYAISLQSVIGLNESIIESLLPYTISVPYLGIVLLTSIFFGTLLVSYSIIVWRGMQKTDRKKSVSLTIL